MPYLTTDTLNAIAKGEPQPGQIYRHYKGGRYMIVCRSLRVDDMVMLVTYHKLPEPGSPQGTNWTRTLENFCEQVGTGPRFQRET